MKVGGEATAEFILYIIVVPNEVPLHRHIHRIQV